MRTARLAALFLAGLLALGPGLARADELDQALKEVRQACEAREAAPTMQALRQLIALAWDRLPFSVLNVRLLAAPPAGFGRYVTRVDNVFRQSEPMIIYMEPVGFKVRHDAKEGTYAYDLSADFNLVDAWGRVVGGRRDFWHAGGKSYQFPDRFPLDCTYSLSGLPPGDYRVETTLRDQLGKQSQTVVTPFKITGP